MARHSIYPRPPPGSKILVRVNEREFSAYDQLVVYLSSLFFVGGLFWVPVLYGWAIGRLSRIPKEQKRRRALYTAALVCITALYAVGPHRKSSVGDKINVRKWSLWRSWVRFFAFEIVADSEIEYSKQVLVEKAIVGVSPHGIFPFGLAFATLSDLSSLAFGRMRPVVASATQLIPFVRDVLKWVRAVDASRPAVESALSSGSRIGLAPGGIAEMFEGYPKPNSHPNEEYIIIRKGIFRLAMKYNVPMIPVYCFGSTKLLKRVQFPQIIERISLLIRTSLVLFFGQYGLPIPYRQRLLYVMGNSILPPSSSPSTNQNQQLDDFVTKYCNELTRCFDRHKESYGWEEKVLRILKF